MDRRIYRVLFAALALWVAALPAFGAGGGGDDGNIFTGDIGNIVWTLVVFLLVVVVLRAFAWGPILEGLQQRENFIRDSLEEARKDRDDAKGTLQKYEDRLAEARAEATAIVEEGRRDAEVVRQRIEEKAQEEADKMLERAKREISIASETAVKDLYTLSGQLATGVASKIVARELKPEDHERLINDALDQLMASGDQTH